MDVNVRFQAWIWVAATQIVATLYALRLVSLVLTLAWSIGGIIWRFKRQTNQNALKKPRSAVKSTRRRWWRVIAAMASEAVIRFFVIVGQCQNRVWLLTQSALLPLRNGILMLLPKSVLHDHRAAAQKRLLKLFRLSERMTRRQRSGLQRSVSPRPLESDTARRLQATMVNVTFERLFELKLTERQAESLGCFPSVSLAVYDFLRFSGYPSLPVAYEALPGQLAAFVDWSDCRWHDLNQRNQMESRRRFDRLRLRAWRPSVRRLLTLFQKSYWSQRFDLPKRHLASRQTARAAVRRLGSQARQLSDHVHLGAVAGMISHTMLLNGLLLMSRWSVRQQAELGLSDRFIPQEELVRLYDDATRSMEHAVDHTLLRLVQGKGLNSVTAVLPINVRSELKPEYRK